MFRILATLFAGVVILMVCLPKGHTLRNVMHDVKNTVLDVASESAQKAIKAARKHKTRSDKQTAQLDSGRHHP